MLNNPFVPHKQFKNQECEKNRQAHQHQVMANVSEKNMLQKKNRKFVFATNPQNHTLFTQKECWPPREREKARAKNKSFAPVLFVIVAQS